jgi:hypothetical protein
MVEEKQMMRSSRGRAGHRLASWMWPARRSEVVQPGGGLQRLTSVVAAWHGVVSEEQRCRAEGRSSMAAE